MPAAQHSLQYHIASRMSQHPANPKHSSSTPYPGTHHKMLSHGPSTSQILAEQPQVQHRPQVQCSLQSHMASQQHTVPKHHTAPSDIHLPVTHDRPQEHRSPDHTALQHHSCRDCTASKTTQPKHNIPQCHTGTRQKPYTIHPKPYILRTT